MNIIGIVTEYNPFHNGHKYQIDTIKKMYPDSILIAITSSSFTQRGEISLFDKWTKTKISLDNGIDLVVELPFLYSTESADTFASSSIKILKELKIDTLVFGSETNDVNLFKDLASMQLNNNEYSILVKKYLSLGNNYPTSLSKALKELTNVDIKNPNDLLAISYTKEVLKTNPNINIISIKRTSDYHDTTSIDNIISASNIRGKLFNNEDIKKYVPRNTYKYYKDINIDYDLLFKLLKYKIISDNDLSKYQTVDEGIENRIIKSINECNSYGELIEKIKTKRYTYNRINRMLIHILMSYTKDDKKDNPNPSYIRILGMDMKGKKYLNSIKKDVNLPIITKFINNEELNYELRITKIYSMITNKPNLVNEEYKNNVIIKED